MGPCSSFEKKWNQGVMSKSSCDFFSGEAHYEKEFKFAGESQDFKN